ncbi:hypothetical protein SEA_MACGULLY_9 [Rhodococcus phage MacGully]|nr:hypothetical protein SEA_MACGULLY_9 [Rhodococcus phage MacGully]
MTELKRYRGPYPNPETSAGPATIASAESNLAECVERREAAMTVQAEARIAHEKAIRKLNRAARREEEARRFLAETERNYRNRVDEVQRLASALDKVKVQGKLMVPAEPAPSEALTMVQFEVTGGTGETEVFFLRRLGGDRAWARLNEKGFRISTKYRLWDQWIEQIAGFEPNPQRVLDSARVIAGQA